MPEHDGGRARCCSLRLLGRWQLVADGAEVGLGHREERLVALLGLTGRSSRLHVAGVLWPESTDARALASLRRAVLQTQQRCPGLLDADRLSIGLGVDVEVDVDRLRYAAAAIDDPVLDGGATALLEQLTREELLPGWYDDWVLPERERLAHLRLTALERVARHALDAGDLELAVAAARAASDADPLLESAAELAIRAHLGRGDLGSALLEFARYRDAVRDELGAPPSRTILELIESALTETRAVRQRSRDPAAGIAAVTRPAPVTSAVTRVEVAPPPPRAPVESSGVRGAVVRLLGVAAMILATAIAVAGTGAGRGGDVPGVTADPPMRVLTVDHAIRASQMVVRLVDAAAGRAAFLVRTELQPALVRLEVRGEAGRDVVQSVLVRSPQGRRLELSGLQPGTYRWLATSKVASAVAGRLHMPDQAPVEPADTTVAAARPATTTESTAPAASTPDPAPSPSPPPSPPSGNSSPDPSPAPRHHPTGQPKDPGTRAPGPVG